MKKYFLVLLLTFPCLMATGQGFDWVFFSESGENFTLTIDGMKINTTPQSRVVAKNIKGVLKTVRIQFEDTRIPQITKRVPLRPKLTELTTVIKQNAKGEYILRTIDGTENVTDAQNAGVNNPGYSVAPTSQPTQPIQPTSQAAAPAPTAQPTQPSTPAAPVASSSGPLTAKFDGKTITLSNGKTYNVKRERDQSGMNGPQVIMKAPEGAAVTITQDGGKEVYNGDVPFVYTVKDYNYYNTYFKLEVTEGGQKWSVKMQNGTSYRFVIEEGSPATVTSQQPVTPVQPVTQVQPTPQATAAPQQANALPQPAPSPTTYGPPTTQGGTPVNWIIYSEMGERFIVFLDGQRINANYEESVTATNLTPGGSKGIRIEFEDKSIPKLLKRYPIVAGGDMTIVLKKKKKGEFVARVVSAPSSGTPIPDMEAPTAAPATSSSGPVTAKYDGESINLSNGKSYTVKRERDQSGMNPPQVIMKAPEGATVVITQDGGKEVYNGEVPFVYSVKSTDFYNTYFKLEVTEGGQTWSVKMQNGTGYRLVITE